MEIVRRNPGHPAEVGQGLKEVVGEPKVDKHGAEGPHEKLVARDAIDTVEGAGDGVVAVVVQGRVERNGYQTGGPDAVGWVDDEAAGETCQTVADEVGGEGLWLGKVRWLVRVEGVRDKTYNEDLIAKASGILLVEILRQHLRPDNVLCIRKRLGGVGHNGNEHVFLLVEWTGVETMLPAEHAEAIIRHPTLPPFTEWVRQELDHVGLDRDGRLADAEELVDES